jgi:hypothetical protein
VTIPDQVFVLRGPAGEECWRAVVSGELLPTDFQSKGAAEAALQVERLGRVARTGSSQGAELAFACPRCGYAMEDATSIDGNEVTRPRPGDVGLCITCGAPIRYQASASARWMTFEEIKGLAPEHKAKLLPAVMAILTLRPSRIRAIEREET